MFSFTLNTFSFAAVNSKTPSRARDRKGVYTQNSKMAAQNGGCYFVNNNITIHEVQNKRNKEKISLDHLINHGTCLWQLTTPTLPSSVTTSVNTLLMCWSQFLQWVSVFCSLQPRYRFKTWSKSIMGTDRLRGLDLNTDHSGAVPNIAKMGHQWSPENCFSFLQIKARP